jgi:hypothetical protein
MKVKKLPSINLPLIRASQMPIWERLVKEQTKLFLVRSILSVFTVWMLAALILCTVTRDYSLLIIGSSPFAVPLGLVFKHYFGK